jgi:hypothetical protein
VSFANATRTVTELASWSFQIGSEATEKIHWLHPSTKIIAGTAGPIYIVEGLTPTTLTAELFTTRGSSAVHPASSDAQIIFGSNKHERVFSAGFEDTRQSLVPEELTSVADHLFTRNNQIIQIGVQEEPWSLIWVVREDGMLATCTYDLIQGVKAWARQPLGGSHSFNFYNFKTQQDEIAIRPWASCKSAAVIPASDGRTDEVWMVTERSSPVTDDPSTFFRSIEVLQPRFEIDGLQEDAYYVDCGIAPIDVEAIDTPAATVTGHDVLFNRTVDLWIDGAVQAQVTASAAGLITFPNAAEYKIVVGIPYRYRWDSLSIEALLSDIPTLKGIQSYIASLQVFFLNTLGGKIGAPGSPLQIFDFRSIQFTPMDEGPAVFTGNYEIEAFPADPERTNVLTLQGTGPEPMFLTHMIARIVGGVDSR